MSAPPKPDRRIMVMPLLLSLSNKQLLHHMRTMKRARENRAANNVICSITGFGSDPRELWDIPEARAFCRRLVAVGFISYLDATTTLDPRASRFVRNGFGAAEVWLTGEGRFGPGLRVTPDLLDELAAVIGRANDAATAALGPFEPRPR